jgi:hypothetical protein
MFKFIKYGGGLWKCYVTWMVGGWAFATTRYIW